MNQTVNFKMISREWLDLKKYHVKYSTYIKYKNIIDKHLLMFFIGSKGNPWDEKIFIEFINILAQKNDISVSMKHSIIFILKGILKYGEEKYHFNHVSLSKIKISRKKHEIKILSDSNKKKLADYCLENMNYTTLAIYISMYSGLRLGEICGLKWKDIDFDDKIISVNKTVLRIEDEKNQCAKTSKMIFSPKTMTSQRLVVMTDFLCDYISHYKKIMSPQSNEYFLISNSLDIPETRNIQRNFKIICSKLDFHINFHSLRHSFATNYIKYGMDVKTLSELLGHSTITTTMNLYVHPTIEYKREQINKIPK